MIAVIKMVATPLSNIFAPGVPGESVAPSTSHARFRALARDLDSAHLGTTGINQLSRGDGATYKTQIAHH